MAMDAIGREQVLRLFKQLYTDDNQYFAVFESAGKKEQKRTWKTEGDLAGGTAFLDAYLKDLEALGDTSALTIRFYEELDKGKITPKSEWCQSMQFRIKEAGYGSAAAAPAGGQASDFTNFLMMQWQQEKEEKAELLEELNEIRQEIQELQEQPQGAGADMGFIGQIGAVGQQYPWMQDIMKDVLYMAKKIFSKPDPMRSATIAGMQADPNATPDVRMNAALKVLIEYYVTKAGDKTKGFTELAQDLEMLAQMTADPLDFDYAIAKMRSHFKQPA